MKKSFIKKMILQNRIIAIIRGVEEEHIIDVVTALVSEGIKVLEITFDHNDNNYIQNTIKKLEMCKEHFGSDILLGVGTVLNEEEVKLAVNAGAEFVISPDFNQNVIKLTNDLNKVSIPGAVTPTEMVKAYKYGADFVKLFPAGKIGLDYIKAVLTPLSHIPTIAVGGVNSDNYQNYLDIGVIGVGIGSDLIDKVAIKKGNYDVIKENASKYKIN